MKISQILAIILALSCLSLPACQTREEQSESGNQKIVVTSPLEKDVILTQPYVCQIHSQNHIKVKALMGGYLEEILVKEGQGVRKGSLMFKILPILYKANMDAEMAEAKIAELELKFTEKLAKLNTVSENEVALYRAKLTRAEARAEKAKAEWKFTKIEAPFDGIVDRLHEQLGSLIKEGDVLTTLSDNSGMWVYFNVPEAHYIKYQKEQGQLKEDPRIELRLAGGSKFSYSGKFYTIEAVFNNETGTVPFRADFPNPNRVLRHGMTGNVLIHRTLSNAILIPQRATFEILDRRYVFVVNREGKVHQREIVIQNELQDIYVIKSGLSLGDRFIFEGVRQVRDGDKIEYEFRPPEQVLAHQNFHAE